MFLCDSGYKKSKVAGHGHNKSLVSDPLLQRNPNNGAFQGDKTCGAAGAAGRAMVSVPNMTSKAHKNYRLNEDWEGMSP